MGGIRRRPRANPLLLTATDQHHQRPAVDRGLDVRQRRIGRSADAADRRRWCAVRLHADAQDLRRARRDRRAPVDLRSRNRGPGREPRRHVLEPRQRRACLPGRRSVSLRARRADRQADRDLRRQRPDRLAPRPRSRSAGPERQADEPRRRLQGSADCRRPGWRGAALVAGAHPRVRREDRRLAVDVSHDPAAGRDGLRDVGKGVVDLQRRREQLGRDGARRGTRDCLCADRIGRRRLLWRGPSG